MRDKSLAQKIGELGHRLAVQAHSAWIAARDPQVPLIARFLAIFVAAYALSPIDLVPDFIPIFGWIDDLIIVPIGLWAVRKLVPSDIWARCQAEAESAMERPSSRAGMVMILVIWAAALYLLYWAVKIAPLH
jgi:uncharacterized membrane protein YkvA (DUF1232 family)